MTPPVILAAAAGGTLPTSEPTSEPTSGTTPEPTSGTPPTNIEIARANPRSNVRSNVRTVETFPPIIDSASIKQQRDRIINYNEKFYIEYTYYETDNKKVTKYFNFSLLPAIETTVQYSSSGNFRGNASVPEVRPGIPIRTAVKHKNIVCPGGTTVIQTVGIEGKFIALVGAFTGTEDAGPNRPNSTASLDSVYLNNTKNDTVPSATSSYLKALQFDHEVVQEGREVTVYIDTVDKEQKKYTLKIKGIINEFRFQAVRRFKTYYSISMVITDFPQFNK